MNIPSNSNEYKSEMNHDSDCSMNENEDYYEYFTQMSDNHQQLLIELTKMLLNYLTTTQLKNYDFSVIQDSFPYATLKEIFQYIKSKEDYYQLRSQLCRIQSYFPKEKTCLLYCYMKDGEEALQYEYFNFKQYYFDQVDHPEEKNSILLSLIQQCFQQSTSPLSYPQLVPQSIPLSIQSFVLSLFSPQSMDPAIFSKIHSFLLDIFNSLNCPEDSVSILEMKYPILELIYTIIKYNPVPLLKEFCTQLYSSIYSLILFVRKQRDAYMFQSSTLQPSILLLYSHLHLTFVHILYELFHRFSEFLPFQETHLLLLFTELLNEDTYMNSTIEKWKKDKYENIRGDLFQTVCQMCHLYSYQNEHTQSILDVSHPSSLPFLVYFVLLCHSLYIHLYS